MTTTSQRLIVIDDDHEWCVLLEVVAQTIGFQLDISLSLEEAKVKLATAQQQQQSYVAAIIDMNFEMGRARIAYPRGKEVVQFIKSNYPQTACIMVSGSMISPEQALDMRDDYDLDYYVQKDKFDIDAFNQALKKAMRRVERRVELRYKPTHIVQELHDALTSWEQSYWFLSRNLAAVQERAAKKGLDVDVATINEIELYRANMREAEGQLGLIRQRLAELEGSIG